MGGGQKIAIVCEDWKVPKFTEELIKINVKFELSEFMKGMTTIVCLNTSQDIIGPLTTKVTAYFSIQKHSKKN